MHEKYGPVVRIRPNELAFSDPQAWQDIYGHKVIGKKAGLQSGVKELPKFLPFYKQFEKQPDSLLTASYPDHAVMRKLVSPSFSDKAMREQEPIITGYIDQLLECLREGMTKGPLNMTQWYNWATFDIIGDLAFGDSFHCLKDTTYHPFVKLISQNPRDGARMVSLRYLGYKRLAIVMLFTYARAGLQFRKWAKETMTKRLELGKTRPDLIEPFIEKKNQGELTFAQLRLNAGIFIVAGSETTASLLAAVTYLLLTHPDCLAKVNNEVRTAFQSEEDITLAAVQNLPYMIACLTEALRYYPPTPTGFPRIAPEGGANITGTYVPEGVSWKLLPNSLRGI
jgi:cytochrome P450